MSWGTLPVGLHVTVHRDRWIERYDSEPARGLPPYVHETVTREADRLGELGARILLVPPKYRIGPPTAWVTVTVELLVDVEIEAWTLHYGLAPERGVPPYVTHVMWQSNVCTRDGATVEPVAQPTT